MAFQHVLKMVFIRYLYFGILKRFIFCANLIVNVKKIEECFWPFAIFKNVGIIQQDLS